MKPSIPRFVGATKEQVWEISVQATNDPIFARTAEGIASRAREIARKEGHPELADVTVVQSVRPKGRGQYQVVIDHEDAESHEYGDENVSRSRILGRAAGVEIWPGDGEEGDGDA